MPLLIIIACALPSDRCSLVTISGAPFTRFVVYTAAAFAFVLLYISERSFLSLFFLIPQCTPAASKPFAAHIPPSMIFIISSISIIFASCLAVYSYKIYADLASPNLYIKSCSFIYSHSYIHTFNCCS